MYFMTHVPLVLKFIIYLISMQYFIHKLRQYFKFINQKRQLGENNRN